MKIPLLKRHKQITLFHHTCALLYIAVLNSYVQSEEYPNYYDDLRARVSRSTNVTVITDEGNEGKVLHLVEDGGDPIRLCHVPVFLQYTDGEENNAEITNDDSYAVSAGALLAAYHFNNGIDTIVPRLKKTHETCNVRLTAEVFDTSDAHKKALNDLLELTLGRAVDNVATPKPCALLGSSLRDVNDRLATVAELYDLLQVSPIVTAYEDNDRDDRPLLARTNPTDVAWVERLVEYLYDELDVRFLAILYDDTREGEAFQSAIQEARREYGDEEEEDHRCGNERPKINLQIEQHKISYDHIITHEVDKWSKDLKKKLEDKFTDKNVKYRRGFNYFVGYFKTEHFEQVMAVCKEVGIVGENGINDQPNVWFFRNVPDTIENAAVAEAVNGSGIVHYEGGFEGNVFENEWNKMSETMLNYIHRKQPSSIRETDRSIELVRDAYFSYDAMIGIGLAACEVSTGNQNVDSNYVSGMDHYDRFVKNSFVGASGNVQFDEDNDNARSTDSVPFFVSNILVFDGKVRPTRTSYYNVSESDFEEIDDRDFIYADGGTSRPRDKPDVIENANEMTNGVRGTGLAMCAIAMMTSVGFIVYTYLNRKEKVMRMSQPPFLYMVAVGSFIMSSSIIPLSIDHGIADPYSCMIACNAKFWLLCTGFTTMFSALFSKLWRIIKLISSAKKMKRVTIKPKDVIKPFVVLMGLNLIILIVQAVVNPIKWSRDASNVCDDYNQLIESRGRCDYSDFMPYGVSLVIVNAIALVAAIIAAWQARNMSTELQESKYIAIAMLSTFETFLFLVPVAVLVGNIPTVSFFVYATSIFVISMSVLLLIFVPKIYAIKHPSAPTHLSDLIKTTKNTSDGSK